MLLRPLLVVLAAVLVPLDVQAGPGGVGSDPGDLGRWVSLGHDALPTAPTASGWRVLDSAAELDGSPDPAPSEGFRVAGHVPLDAILIVAGPAPSGFESRLHLNRCGHSSNRLDLPPPILR